MSNESVKEKEKRRPKTLLEALSSVMDVREARPFKINDVIVKDGGMGWAFIVFKRKRDGKMKVGLVRYNPYSLYVHSVVPLPEQIEEFVEQMKQMYNIKRKIEEEEEVKEAERRVYEILEKLSPKEREIIEMLILSEIEKIKSK